MTTNRIVILDCETTGFYPSEDGDRLIEIGIIELIDRKKTGVIYHEYVDPGFETPEGALKVHGLTREALIAAGNGQKFSDIAEDLSDFIGGDLVIAHNAPFDASFLDFELSRLDLPTITESCKVFDTLAYANVKHPGQRNNLNALCKRYGVDNSSRSLHGALLDADLLAQVYLLLTRNQQSLDLNSDRKKVAVSSYKGKRLSPDISKEMVINKVSLEEETDHENILKRIDKESSNGRLWR